MYVIVADVPVQMQNENNQRGIHFKFSCKEEGISLTEISKKRGSRANIRGFPSAEALGFGCHSKN